MFECELVREFVGCTSEDRSVEEEIQRGAAAQQFGEFAAAGVCATHCGSPVAYGSLRAAMRRTKRGRSHVFRGVERRMILCANPGGWSLRGGVHVTAEAEPGKRGRRLFF